MIKLKGFSLFVMVLLCLFVTHSSWSQTNFSIKIYATDGSGWTDSVTIGKNTAATFGIDAGLGETELPPVPPSGGGQAADFRALDPTDNNTFGQGLGVDLRDLVSNFQRDVYRIAVRRSDPEGSTVTLSWPAGLGSVGGGGWYLTDGAGGAIFPNVNMATQTSFTHASLNTLAGAEVFIVSGDGRLFRTFTIDSLSYAKDSKGKFGKPEKRKALGSEGCFTFTNASGDSADALYVEWSQIITGHLSMDAYTTFTAVDPVKPAKGTYTGTWVQNTASVEICLKGNKGKQLNAKKWYFKKGGAQAGATGPLLLPSSGDRLTYNRPNSTNVGEEIFLQGAFPTGLTIGSDPNKSMTMFKYKDLLKTMVNWKLGILANGTPYCLDTLLSKPLTKFLKAVSPDKMTRYKPSTDYGNRLLIQLAILKFNMAASATNKTEPGFGGLVYNDPSNPLDAMNGKTIAQIATAADHALSCDNSQMGTYTLSDMAATLSRLNAEFSGTFDTTSFGTGKTETSGVKALALVDYLTATAIEQPSQYTGNFSELYDVPKQFGLSQNYPNPFNPTTTIDFTLPADAFVTLKVYNMLGQEVATLLNREEMSEGDNSVDFDAARLSTGVYYYRLVVNDGELQQVRKMMLMK
jgi:hypothetical protein